ncbi:TIM-barrel domain-containing protein [Actinospica sp.]|uniref:TIM-barrel domain-containing protein n=1 Tax=Actinospica sp. TaxID=1872142 RepID=UPI002C5A2D79|nr:TIM-barrel domain-containing protein [Actinospica sp.]HWG26515.1 TIM-barrel domain-containing protein [Actinospica sp.]
MRTASFSHALRPRRRGGALITAAIAVALVMPVGAAAAQTATSDTSPVNLSNSINLANGKAAAAATVVEGDARFEVLAPEVIRTEYSPTGSFLDDPTFDIMDRNFTVPAYTSSVSNGWLTITTSQMTFSYQLGSGPFSTVNTKMQLLGALPPGASANVTPTWGSECTFGQACQAGAATLSGGASIAGNHLNYLSPAGFVAGLGASGADASWQVLGAPAGSANVAIRYANSTGGDGNNETRTESLVVNGVSTLVSLPTTANWDSWSTVTVPVTLTAGTNTVAVDCVSGDSCNVNIDDIAVNASGASAAPFLPANPLGGYIRSYDSVNGSYSGGTPTCATCAANIPQMAPGLLDKSGWYLLDDSKTAVWTSDGWVANRPAGDIEDGYLFGYGQDYAGALSDLAKLTGPATLPDESVFGNWFSQYDPYSTAAYEGTILPRFQANGVSLDDLSVDTDWKSPNTWNGWEWNPSLFPDPTAFTDWAASQDIDVALNVHSAIATNDPLYAQAQSIAGNSLTTVSSCNNGGPCAVWDWANVAQAESYFATADPTQNSVAMTWLDWCCDGSGVFSQPGVTPDAWINYLTAQQMVNDGERGFDLSRVGASNQASQAGAYPAGPWADHRSAIAFTGDTQGTWNTLASEAQLSQDEGSIGEPYVSDDIGSFLGSNTTGNGNDPDDLYLRWLQLGTFQPIMREHSDEVDWGQNARLPWEYDAATQAVGDQFMQLREQLVPYLYTLAEQASSTGIPMTQALYLDYPGQAAAYTNPTEYTLGPDVLVAPVTQPGASVATQVWFPPGTWQDYFTGATFTGPGTQTFNVPTSRMPVFVKEGGIIPLQPSSGQAQTAGTAPITLQVHAGANGTYSLYDDTGTGLGYRSGQSTSTPIGYTENASAHTSTLTISPAAGSYPGEPASRTYTLDLVDESQPTSVQINGQTIATSQWTYNAATDTLQVAVGAVSTTASLTVTQVGGSPVQLAEPSTPRITFASPSSAAAGKQVTITGSGFGASQGSSYLTFSDNGTNWGAPGDAASFTINSWSDSAVTFTVPQPSGTNGQWAVTPNTSATVSVTTGGGTSNTTTTAIGSTTAPAGEITGYQGLCIDDRGALTTNYNPIQAYTCNNSTAQQWTVGSDGTLQVLGMCMDVNGGNTTNGTVVDLYTCNSTAAQDWVAQPSGALANPQSGKCLEDNGNGGSGTQLIIEDCNGQSDQKWTLP